MLSISDNIALLILIFYILIIQLRSVATYISLELLAADPSSPVASLSTIRPSLKDLVRHAVPRIAPAWYDVGLLLDLEPDVLDEIEKEKLDQPRKMFAKWLQGSSCTWQSVLNAVEIIRGGKPMEDIRAAVVESIAGAQSTGQHTMFSLNLSLNNNTLALNISSNSIEC